MFHLDVKYQESFSRSELLLRTFLGAFYIFGPHGLLLFFVGIASSFIALLSALIILLKGQMPESFYKFQLGYLRWASRLHTRAYNLSDGYPSFGINGTDDYLELDIDYIEDSDRLSVLMRFLFGPIYVTIPHAFVWVFRNMASSVLSFIAFWVVLFTGSYPQSWHEFNVGTLRWIIRVNAYMIYLTDKYPPFSGK